jgi:hypothetical protein
VKFIALVVLFALAISGCAHRDVSTNARLKSVGDDVFQVGAVKLNKRERSVSFTAVPNITNELAVEYAVVHRVGKTHESLLRTDARAQDIQVAMLLLGAKPAMTNMFPEDLALPPPGEAVTIEVTWNERGKTVRHALEELILSRETGKPLTRGPWFYNGSNFSEGSFTAQRDGSIISIHIDPDALVNNPRPGRDNDDLHIPNTPLLPPLGTEMEVTMRLGKQ